MGIFSGFGARLKDLGRNVLNLYSGLFGIDELAKSKEGQELQDSANDLLRSVGRGPVFNTEKEKAAQKRCQEQHDREVQEQIAQNTKDIADALRTLLP